MIYFIHICLFDILILLGSHCLDLESSLQSDPEWLIEKRKKKFKIIQGWFDQYNAIMVYIRNQKVQEMI